ncbi:hypothetical protein AALO_G00266220 [Alosa alosa]|uniref:Uncharacterized protein n=1 Tax=Alosa alosa TaxID=278164 RepID=A0AAV6FKZ9_9TELE|nr:hypothetical protein AALO_G00266220 [Alosa alosa]
MGLSLGSIILLCFLCHCNSQPLPRPSNGLQECWKTMKMPALGVLPGGGWDNLRNLDMGRVMNITYGHCHTTEDGVYLVPDEVFVIPQKVSDVEMNAEILSSWYNEHSSTARSINADASFLPILNAKFSSDNERVKSHQLKERSVTACIEVCYHLYTVKAYPDFTLDLRFARQAQEIADALENNQTRQAIYLSEKLFSQHLAAISDGCQVLYCVQSNVFTADHLLPINLPPFTRPPLVKMLGTKTIAVMTEGDNAWVRVGETKAWRRAKPEDIRNLSEDLDPSNNISGWQIFGSVMCCIVFVFIIIGIVLLLKWRNRRSGFAGNVRCERFNNDGQTSDCGENL